MHFFTMMNQIFITAEFYFTMIAADIFDILVDFIVMFSQTIF